MNLEGFTLVETLLVTAIIAVVLVFSVSSYGKFINMNSLNTQIDEVRKNIRLAQQRAETGKYKTDHGVNFSTSSYTLFSGTSFSSRDESKDEKFDLTENLEFTQSFDLVFDKDTGLPVATGTIKIKNNGNNESKDIEINEYGLVY